MNTKQTMTKAVSLTLGLLFLLASAAQLRAQTNDTDFAVLRAVQDQANTIVLRGKLEDAKAAAGRGDLEGAAKLYEDAYEVASQIGSGIDVETAQTISGLAATRLALARQAQSQGDLREADTQVNRVLKVDPKNADALAFKKQNDEMAEAMRGKVADQPTLERKDIVDKEKMEAGTLVQDGVVLIELGKLEEAEAKLNEALKLDPDSEGAFYYLNQIKQNRYAREENKASTAAQDSMVKVESAYNTVNMHFLKPSQLNLPEYSNPYATNDLIYTGPGRQAIVSKLDHIRLDKISYDTAVPLSEVLRSLGQIIKTRDPEKKGINFLINNNADASSAGAPAAGVGGAATIDPTTGLPAANPGATPEAVDIGSYLIKFDELDDVRLADVLNAIVMVADHPIKYSILDYAVVFSAKGPDQVQLSERTFRVDPNTFYSGLESVSSASFGSVNNSSSGNGGGGSGGGGGNNGGGGNSGGGGSGNSSGGTVIAVVNSSPGAGSFRSSGNNGGGGGGGGGRGGGGRGGGGATGGAGGAGGGGGGTTGGGGGGLSFITSRDYTSDVNADAKAYFTAVGINMDTPPGKSVVFNDRLGLLFVRATDQDLDTIEKVIQALNQVSPQVHIKSRFIEISQDDSKALGFDWYLGQFGLGKSVVGTGGSSPSQAVPVSAANPLGAFPGNTAASLVPASAGDQLLTSGLQNSAPTLATFTGILTDPNFRVAIHALEQRSGAQTLGEPEVTTTSGRQTQMRATKIINVITGFEFNNGTGGEGAAATAPTTGTTTTVEPGAASVTPDTQQVETGPILDVVPYVLSDGFTISMALIPSDTEFGGYDQISATAIPGYNPGAQLAGIANGTAVPVALPNFTVRQVVTTVNVWDNQTVVLGGLITSGIQTTKDKVPFLGDLPFAGRLFQSQSKTETKDNLMVFVTATIVDPAGNRVHSDDELPFAQTTIPSQTVVPAQTLISNDPTQDTK
jgi:type II secretory pathway component GspD/PulD (secretin)/tetratricopeptide (TPR) repeat protein